MYSDKEHAMEAGELEQERRDQWAVKNKCLWSAEREDMLLKADADEMRWLALNAKVRSLLDEMRKEYPAGLWDTKRTKSMKAGYAYLFKTHAASNNFNKGRRVLQGMQNHDASILLKKQLEAMASKKSENEAKAKLEEARLINEAVKFLLARGLNIGVDFEVFSAHSVADNVAYDEECKRRIVEVKASGGFTGFNGDDYCEECPGWDAESRRCDCGNRRVYWQMGDGHSFEKPSVDAEAY